MQLSGAAFGGDGKSLGLGLELYTYVSIVNCLTSYGLPDTWRVPLPMVSESFGCLSSHDTIGDMFNGCHRLFNIIPQVTYLAGLCLSHQRRLNDWDPDWKPPESLAAKDTRCYQIRLAAEVVKHALKVYLSTAMLGATPPSPTVWAHIQSEILKAYSLFRHISSTESLTILLWPLVVLGSCTVRADHQDLLIRGLTTSCFEMRHLSQICEVLRLLWNDPDPLAFGPRGLYLTTQKHGLSISIL